jgi:hypothetical protein
MLDPMTGIRLGEEVDALREENARLRRALETHSAEMLRVEREWADRLSSLGETIERVKALHHEDPERTWRGETTCAYCHDEDGEFNRWPCPTALALAPEVK